MQTTAEFAAIQCLINVSNLDIIWFILITPGLFFSLTLNKIFINLFLTKIFVLVLYGSSLLHLIYKGNFIAI